jgi:hypothetical protein
MQGFPATRAEPVCDKASPSLNAVENVSKFIIISYLEDTFPHTLAVPSTKPISRAERFRIVFAGGVAAASLELWRADVNSTK